MRWCRGQPPVETPDPSVKLEGSAPIQYSLGTPGAVQDQEGALPNGSNHTPVGRKEHAIDQQSGQRKSTVMFHLTNSQAETYEAREAEIAALGKAERRSQGPYGIEELVRATAGAPRDRQMLTFILGP